MFFDKEGSYFGNRATQWIAGRGERWGGIPRLLCQKWRGKSQVASPSSSSPPPERDLAVGVKGYNTKRG